MCKVSRENVENVENPPQKPMTNRNVIFEDSKFLSRYPTRIPNKKEAAKFAENVAQGHLFSGLKSPNEIEYLKILPKPPPKKT